MSNDILQIQGINSKGYGIVPKLIMQDKRLTVEAKAIYAYFCSYAGAGQTAFPSRSKIISDLNISINRYYKHFNLLLDNGYIKVEQVKSDKGKFERNIYTLIQIIPCSQNSYTEKTDLPCINYPYADNPCMDNRYTNNNSIKINNININSESESERASTPTNTKNIYGDYQNVKLTQSEYDSLIQTIGEKKTKHYIKRIGSTMANKGTKYASHFQTIKDWCDEDTEKESEKPKPEQNTQACSTPKHKNRFVNFEQREWDFDKIKQLEENYIEQKLSGSM